MTDLPKLYIVLHEDSWFNETNQFQKHPYLIESTRVYTDLAEALKEAERMQEIRGYPCHAVRLEWPWNIDIIEAKLGRALPDGSYRLPNTRSVMANQYKPASPPDAFNPDLL
jgi:hypothetical protein